MGQKVNPVGMRLGINRTWDSRWFADKEYASLLKEDIVIRRYIKSRLERAGISRIVIERAPKRVTVNIHTARPGIVIGRKGAEVDKLRDELQHLTDDLGALKAQIPVLNESIRDLKGQQVSHDKVVDHLREQESQLEEALKQAETAYKLVQSKRDAWQAELHDRVLADETHGRRSCDGGE